MNSVAIQIIFLVFLSTAYCKPREIGQDNDYVNGGFNPGKRCVNMWDEGCVNGQLPGSGQDNDYVNGGFNPGKRCVNTWDEGCGHRLPASGANTAHHKPQNYNGRILHILAQLYNNNHY